MKTGFFAIIALLMVSFGCVHTLPEVGIRLDKSLATKLKESPETISIDGEKLLLSAFLWRNFMPTTGKTDSSMRAGIMVTSSNEAPVPEALEITGLIIVKNDSVWVAETEIPERLDQQIIQASAKGGPEWNVGDKVDVVVVLYDGDQTYYLRKGEVTIQATH